ncbi:MAG: hypothetical protein JXA18_11565 [Chitinispirillaceae bacterium]|nr:hypothetical protein [Chitinispirillaceae bacterium]
MKAGRMNAQRHIAAVVVVTAFFAIEGATEKSGLAAHGSLQFDASGWYRGHAGADSTLLFAGTNMLTLTIRTLQPKSAKVEGLIDIYQVYGTYAALVHSTANDRTITALSGSAPILADLRMLYGALYLPWADITLGRQVVNYGKGMLLSPLDVFSTVNLFELSFKRSGSDIVMASFPLGEVSGIDAVTGFPIGNSDYATSLRAFTTLSGWDVSAAGMYRHHSREGIAGIAFKGDAVAGLTGEIVTRYNRDSREWRFEAMAGADYSIRTIFFFGTEYLYRQEGTPHPVYDRHNLFVSLQYVINDLMSVSLVTLAALPEENALATLQYSWDILQSVNTILYLRNYHLKGFGPLLPQGEAGVRVVIHF